MEWISILTVFFLPASVCGLMEKYAALTIPVLIILRSLVLCPSIVLYLVLNFNVYFSVVGVTFERATLDLEGDT
jgi:hypothetical protein